MSDSMANSVIGYSQEYKGNCCCQYCGSSFESKEGTLFCSDKCEELFNWYQAEHIAKLNNDGIDPVD